MANDSLLFLTELENYSLDSKLLIAQKVSSRLMDSACVSLQKILTNNITPTEIEIFTTYSIVYDSGSTVPINQDSFARIINGIRNYLKIDDEEGFSKRLFSSMMVQQFPSQTSFVQRLFRYNYFFTYANENFSMKDEFESMFGQYKDYLLFATAVYMFMSGDIRNIVGNENAAFGLMKVFELKKVVETLSISPQTFKNEIMSFYNGNTEKLFNGLKINCLFPIIAADDNRYIPNPYLVIDAVTSSLLNRLTENNNELRKNFGKEVIESYLYAMCRELSFKSFLSREFEYQKNKNSSALTSDVLLGINDEYLIFFDTKAKTPKVGIRNLEHISYEKDLNIYVEDYIQLINQYFDYKKGLINLGKQYEIHNVFFIDVMLEDSFIDRKDIANKALEKYKDHSITLEDENNIRSNILLLSLNEIEKYFLRDVNIITDLINHRDNENKWYDIQLNNDGIENTFINSFDKFFDELFGDLKDFYTNS